MTEDTPGSAAGPGGQVQAGVADGGELDVLVPGLVDGVQAEEGEEEVRLDALGAGAVGHDQCRVDALQGTLGHDDGDLVDPAGATGRVVSHHAPSCLVQMQPRGLGMPAIFAASLAGPFGKSSYSSLMLTPEVLLRARTLGPVPFSAYSCRMNLTTCQCGSVSALMPLLGGDLGCHVLAPLLRVGEEALVVDGDLGACVDLGGHGQALSLVPLAGLAAAWPPAASASSRLPASGMSVPTPGMSCPGRSMCQ